MTRIHAPAGALVVLIGPSGAGKTTFARRWFPSDAIVSSDALRAVVSGDEADQSASGDAFRLLRLIVEMRLKRGLRTVVDSTAAAAKDRKALLKLAKAAGAPAVAIVFDVDAAICGARNDARAGRPDRAALPARQLGAIRRALDGLAQEGFARVSVLNGPMAVEGAEVEMVERTGDGADHADAPAGEGWDVIGDVHGCVDELIALLGRLGYAVDLADAPEALGRARHPDGRRALFVGDLVDRGPRNVDALRLIMGMARDGDAKVVIGNHDDKLLRWLSGRTVRLSHGLDGTVAELQARSDAFRAAVRAFFAAMPFQLSVDAGRLLVAHAGLAERYHGVESKSARSFALYGDVSGERDAYGLPVRRDWAADYAGAPVVAYGHTPARRAVWRGQTICLDTGCCFGGALTAMRWPTRELVVEPAHEAYSTPIKPLVDVVGMD